MKTLETPLGPFRVFDEGIITRALEAGQWWDAHLKSILDEADPGLALDIGAHVGWFTRYLARRHAVIAVEPYPPAFQLLQQNVAHLDVQCWPLAAYTHPCLLGLDPRNDRSDAGTFSFTDTPAASPVLAGPLDSCLPTDVPVTLIKCDAQGADLRALVGLDATIRRDRPLIVFEWEAAMAAWHGDTWPDVLDFFADLDYTVARIVPDFYDYVARPA